MTTFSLLLAAATAMDVSPESLDSRRGYVLEFSATWCGPCQQVGPVVARLERQGYPIRKVDIDQEKQLTRKYSVRSIPTFVLVVDGRERDRIVGATSESSILKLLAQVPLRSQQAVEPPGDRSEQSQLADAGSRQRPTQTPTIRASLDTDAPLQPDSNSPGPMSCSVRIRVKDRDGTNFGSGTIVRSHPGRSLILTCGHIVRELSSAATIEADFFTASGPETFTAELVHADQQADLGLLAIRTADALPIASIADSAATDGDRLFSIGCSGGSDPTVERVEVTALNRYLGPDNVECTGVPVQGRSGGGLFNRSGQVIGVCIAADPKDKRGLYTGLDPIREFLQRALNPDSPEADGRALAGQFERPGSITEDVPAGNSLLDSAAPPARSPEAAGLVAQGAQEYSEETIADVEAQLDDAEVICIIRSRKDGHEESRVVIINRASGKFVQYLTHEMRGGQVPRTAMKHRDEMPPDAAPRPSASRVSRPAAEQQVTPASHLTRPQATQSASRSRLHNAGLQIGYRRFHRTVD